jgi:hypothetical protein
MPIASFFEKLSIHPFFPLFGPSLMFARIGVMLFPCWPPWTPVQEKCGLPGYGFHALRHAAFPCARNGWYSVVTA